MTMVTAAHRPAADTSVKRQAHQCAYEIDLAVRHQMANIVRTEMMRQGMLTMDIPEYHDEQRLAADVAGDLGPLAGAFASPQLGRFSQRWQLTSHPAPGVLAGFVVVLQQGFETLPQSYKDLFLGFGVNCVYLEALTDGSGGYQAWITTPPRASPTDETQQACRDEHGVVPQPLKGPLKVVNSSLGLGPTGTPYRQTDMVPAARFLEDNQGKTVIGFPCLAEWCQIGLPGFAPRTKTYCDWFPTGTVYCGTNREAKIASWYDEQQLDERVGNKWVATNIRAAIVPERNLDTYPSSRYTDTRLQVARVYLDRNPPAGSKMFRLGLRYGENRIDLVNNVATGQHWQYLVTPITTPLVGTERALPWAVLGPHRHYDAPVPGTSRFRYTITDPGIWGPCGQDCCDSDGIW